VAFALGRHMAPNLTGDEWRGLLGDARRCIRGFPGWRGGSAEDLVGESCLRALELWDGRDGGLAVLASGCLWRVAREMQRRALRDPVSCAERGLAVLTNGRGPLARVGAQELWRRAVWSTRGGCDATVLLRYYRDGLCDREIAAELGRPRSSITYIRHRALAALRRRWHDE